MHRSSSALHPSLPSSRLVRRRRHLGHSSIEPLEARIAPASALYSNGSFSLSGLPAAANHITILFTASNELQIVLGNGDTFTSAPVAGGFVLSQTTNPNDTLSVDLSQSPFTNGFHVSLGSVMSELDLDFTGANFANLPGNVVGIGVDSAGTVTYTPTGVSGGNIGTSNLTTVHYTSFPTIPTVDAPTDIVFKLPATANSITLGDNGATGDGLTTLSGANFGTLVLANPSNSLTINAGTATDTITVNALPDFDANLILGASTGPFHGITLGADLGFTGAHGLTTFTDVGFSTPHALSLAALSVTAGGDISLTGALTISGQATFDATTSHNVALTNTSNQFNTVGITAAAAAHLVSNQAFNLGASSTDTLLQVQSSASVGQTGALAGNGGLEFGGGGTLTLSLQNSYHGATNIDSGTLLLGSASPSNIIATSPAVAVHAGATLEVGSTGSGTLTLASNQTLTGTGTIDAATIIAASGSGVTPDDVSSGRLHFTGALTFQAGATASFQITTGSAVSFAKVAGDVTLGGASLSFIDPESLQPRSEILLIQNDSADPVSGTFANMAEGAPVAIGGFDYHVTYHGGDGNDVALEPGATIAPSSITFTDVDGDTVKITASHGTLTTADIHLTPGAHGNQLTDLDLTDPSFYGADITLSVLHKGAKGDGKVNVGMIDAGINDLGSVTVAGDLGEITAGSGFDTVPALAKLSVNSFGANGMATGATSSTSVLEGDLGTLAVTKDFSGGKIQVHGNLNAVTIGGTLGGSVGGSVGGGGELMADGVIASVMVGKDLSGLAGGAGVISGGSLGDIVIKGSMIGGAAAFGAGIQSAAGINSITIGGDLHGGSAGDTATIGALGGDLNSLTIKGSFLGGSGATHQFNGDGHIYVSGNLGPVVIGKNYDGGSGALSGQIFTPGTIASLSVGGTFEGGSGSESGKIVANGNLGPITVKKSFDGGSGNQSGQIISVNGNVQSLTVGSYTGGTGDGAGSLSGKGTLGALTVKGAFLGGSGTDSGQFNFTKGIGPIVINGNFTGGTGMGTGDGAFSTQASFTTIFIRGNFLGGTQSSGEFTASTDLASLTIGGNYTSGNGGSSGEISTGVNIGSVAIGGSFTGGTQSNDGLIVARGNIETVTIGKTFNGGSGHTSGSIIATGSMGSLLIKGDFHGGSGSQSGEITASSMGSIFIGGNFDGGSGGGSGVFSATTGGLGSLTIRGSFNGGSGMGSGNINTQGANGDVTIGKNFEGGSGQNSGALNLGDTVSSITIKGNFDGGSALKSGNVNVHVSLALVSIHGNFTGGSGKQSGQFNVHPQFGNGMATDPGLVNFTVGGNFVGGSQLESGQITASSVGTVVIGGNFVGGTAPSAGEILSMLGGITSVAIKGSLMGGTESGTGEILSATDIGLVTIGKNLVGGSVSGMDTVSQAGDINAAHSIRLVQIGGSILAGTNNTTIASALTAAGAIQAGVSIGTITVTGNIEGTTSKTSHLTSTAVISAEGPTTSSNGADLAIGNLTVGGSVSNLNVLAGYDDDLSAENGSAQIGSVSVKGNWTASNLVAGIQNAGMTGQLNFGDANDEIAIPITIGQTTTEIASRIASLVIGGKVLGTPAAMSGTDHFGFVASGFGSITIGGAAVALPTTAAPFVQPSSTTGDVAIHLLPITG